MPTYGYRCPSCSTDFDVWQRMSDPTGAECPACGAAATRQFFPAGIVFKGSGFYKNDSRQAAPTAAKDDKGEVTPGSTEKGSGAPSKEEKSEKNEKKKPESTPPKAKTSAPASSSGTGSSPAGSTATGASG